MSNKFICRQKPNWKWNEKFHLTVLLALLARVWLEYEASESNGSLDCTKSLWKDIFMVLNYGNWAESLRPRRASSSSGLFITTKNRLVSCVVPAAFFLCNFAIENDPIPIKFQFKSVSDHISPMFVHCSALHWKNNENHQQSAKIQRLCFCATKRGNWKWKLFILP